MCIKIFLFSLQQFRVPFKVKTRILTRLTRKQLTKKKQGIKPCFFLCFRCNYLFENCGARQNPAFPSADEKSAETFCGVLPLPQKSLFYKSFWGYPFLRRAPHKKRQRVFALPFPFYFRCNYLFENCGARRAFFKPYFFLSFILESLVKKPAFFKAALELSSAIKRAREIP